MTTIESSLTIVPKQDLCSFCTASGLSSCQNYPMHKDDFCPVDWKPEPEYCDHCGERHAVQGELLCETCALVDAAVTTAFHSMKVLSDASLQSSGRDALACHTEKLTEIAFAAGIVRSRAEAREAATFQMAAE